MSFLNPILLAVGLACVAAPIIIHILMRRKRQPIAWGAMQFLLQAYQQQRRRLRLEQVLLLAARCLIIALLALALGKPVIGAIREGFASPSRTLYVVLDNGLTQQIAVPGAAVSATGDASSSFAMAKARAIEAINQLDMQRGDQAGLIVAAGPAQGLVIPPASDLAQVRRVLEQVEATDSATDLPAAMEVARAAIANERTQGDGGGTDAIVYVASDLRVGSANLSKPLPALATDPRAEPVRIIAMAPASSGIDNVSVRAVSPLRPLVLASKDGGGPDAGLIAVRVDLARAGPSVNSPGISQVSVWAAAAGAIANASPSESAQRVSVNWTSGQTTASVTVSLAMPAAASGDVLLIARCDADAIAGDNIAAAPITLRAGVNVVVVGTLSAAGNKIDSFSPADWFTLALAPAQAQAWQRLSGELRVSNVESRELLGVAAEQLPVSVREADVIIVTQPHELDDGAWRALRAASNRGVMLMITPSDGEQTQLWADNLTETLGTGWKLSREASVVGASGDGGGAAIAGTTSASANDDLLGILRPELPDLLRPVRVQRLLSVVEGSTAGQVLLSLEDASGSGSASRPVVMATRAKFERGQQAGWVVVWLVPPSLSWTDLPAKPLMVPLVQELVRQGVGKSVPTRVGVAGVAIAGTRGGVEAAKQVVWREEAAGIDAQLLALGSANAAGASARGVPQAAGLWAMRDAAGQRIATVAVNADTSASDTTPVDAAAVEKWLSATGASVAMVEAGASGGTGNENAQALGSSRQPPPISLPLLIAAAIVAMLEALMARWFSHATVEKGAQGVTT